VWDKTAILASHQQMSKPVQKEPMGCPAPVKSALDHNGGNLFTGRIGGFMITKILVPSDGSKTAQKAAEYAIDLAKQLKASVIALSVIDQRSFIAQTVPASETARHTIEPIEDYLREAAEGYAGEIKNLCDKSGVASEISIKMGHPVEEILKEAKRSKANLIIMGSHGRSALSATFLGSVSYGVIHKATRIPVLIVRG
jgi:nucleotide-binding universal stress UspA family protein